MDIAAPDHFPATGSASRLLQLTLDVHAHDGALRTDAVALKRLDANGAVIEASGLPRQLGRSVTLGFANGDTLKGRVLWLSERRAGVRWADGQLGTAAVRALRIRHMGSAREVPDRDLAAFRSVA